MSDSNDGPADRQHRRTRFKDGAVLFTYVETLIKRLMEKTLDPTMVIENWIRWKEQNDLSRLPAGLIAAVEMQLKEVQTALAGGSEKPPKSTLRTLFMLLQMYRPEDHPSRRGARPWKMRDMIWFDAGGLRYWVTLAPDFDLKRSVVIFRAEDNWIGFTRVSGKLSLLEAEHDHLEKWLDEARAS